MKNSWSYGFNAPCTEQSSTAVFLSSTCCPASHIQGTHSRASEACEFMMSRWILVHGLILLDGLSITRSQQQSIMETFAFASKTGGLGQILHHAFSSVELLPLLGCCLHYQPNCLPTLLPDLHSLRTIHRECCSCWDQRWNLQLYLQAVQAELQVGLSK